MARIIMSVLEEFGVLHTIRETSGRLGGRPATEYLLNEEQAIYICMKSGAPGALAGRMARVISWVDNRGGLGKNCKAFLRFQTSRSCQFRDRQ